MDEIGVIFDMDGVIIDSEPFHFKVLMKLHKSLGLRDMEKRHSEFVGKSIKNMWQKLKDEFLLDQTVSELMQAQIDAYLKFISTEPILPIVGATDLLEDLHQRGCPMILASSSKMELIDLVVDRLKIRKFFRSCISGDHLPFSKPDPAIYLKAVEEIGLSSNRCIAIEDSNNGVRSAKAAGIHCIAFRNDHFGKQDLSLADWEIDDMKKITYPKIVQLVGK